MENFEDPANETPHNSREGGYQHVWGGPFDAREELQQHFSEAEEEDIKTPFLGSNGRASSIGGALAYAFRTSRRTTVRMAEKSLWPIEAALRHQLDNVEEGIRRLPEWPSMLGHNNPPEGINVTLTRGTGKMDATYPRLGIVP